MPCAGAGRNQSGERHQVHSLWRKLHFSYRSGFPARYTTAMRTVNFTAAIAAPALLLLLNSVAAQAEPPRTKAAGAPPLGECKVSDARDLGRWDDIFVGHELDYVVLRRGDELFSRAMEP